jgi:hypothetical protein
MVTGIYAGIGYTMEKVRGKHDWVSPARDLKEKLHLTETPTKHELTNACEGKNRHDR